MIEQWRFLAFTLFRQVRPEVFSNAVAEFKRASTLSSEAPLGRMLWKVYLAFFHAWMGRYSEAENLYREAAAECEQTLGADSPDTRFARMMMTDYLVSFRGRHEPELESLIRANLDSASRADPRDWKVMARAHKNLLSFARQRADWVEAEVHAHESIAAARQAFAHQSFDLSYHILLVADQIHFMGRTNEGLQMLQSRLAEERTFQEHLGGSFKPMIRLNLSEHLMRSGRMEEARSHLEDGIALYSHLGPLATADFFRWRCELHLKMGRRLEALKDAVRAYRADVMHMDRWKDTTLLLLQCGHQVEYEENCLAGIENFASDQPDVLEAVATSILLGSTNTSALNRAEEMLHRSLRMGHLPSRAGLALADYRFGRWTQAAETGPPSYAEEPLPEWEIRLRVVQAMAQFRLGQAAQAEEALQTSRTLWEKRRMDSLDPYFWERPALAVEILFKEADQLLLELKP